MFDMGGWSDGGVGMEYDVEEKFIFLGDSNVQYLFGASAGMSTGRAEGGPMVLEEVWFGPILG